MPAVRQGLLFFVCVAATARLLNSMRVFVVSEMIKLRENVHSACRGGADDGEGSGRRLGDAPHA